MASTLRATRVSRTGRVCHQVVCIILNSHLTSGLAGILTPAQISAVRSSLNAIETFTPREKAAVAATFARAFKEPDAGLRRPLHSVLGHLLLLVAEASADVCGRREEEG